MTTVERVVQEAQAYFRQFKKDGESVVDEVILEREEEAARERSDEPGPKRNTKPT